MGWTEKKSATWCARSWLVALKYQDRIKNACSGTFSSNFTMDFYMTPFAMQKITNTLSHLLGDAYFKKDIRFAPYTRCYIFEDAEKRPVAAVWNHHPELDAGTLKAPEAEANFKGETPQIFDLMGAQRLVKTEENGNIRFPVSSFPLFFRGKKNSLDNFIKAFTNASLVSGKGFLPVTMNGRPVSPDKLRMLFKNMCSKIFEGKLEYGKTSKTISVPSKGTASINIAVPETLTGNKIIKERIPVKLLRKNGTGKFEFDSSFRGFLCGKTNSEITIDGKLDDWKDIPEIKFKNRYISSRSLKEGIKDIENDDFSGSFKCAWNEKGLYLAVIINDNKFYHKEYEKTGRRWDNDSLQVYFDTLCDARLRDKNAYDENDYDYAVFPSSDGKSSIAYRYYSPDIQLTLGTAAPRDKSIAPEIKTAFKLSGEGYVYEAFFPARYILPIQLKKGYALGFGLFVNDADEPKAIKSSRHISTRSSLTLAPEGKGCYNKPKGWPVMLLWE
jgi:hypothetical protein